MVARDRTMDPPALDAATALCDLALGSGIGLLLGLTGMGGGLLAVPALTVVARLPLETAIGTAGVYLFASQCQALRAHHLRGNVAWPATGRVLAWALPMAAAAACVVHSSAGGRLLPVLRLLIIGAIVLSAVLVARDAAATTDDDVGRTTPPSPWRGPLAALVGGLIGATAVGGGVLIVPLLMRGFGLATVRAVGTSAAVALALFAVISLPAALAGAVSWTTAGLLVAGSLLSVPLGVRLAARLPARWLRRLLVAVMIAAAAAMVATA